MSNWLVEYSGASRRVARGFSCSLFAVWFASCASEPAAVSGSRLEAVNPTAIAQSVIAGGTNPVRPSAVPAPATGVAPSGAAAQPGGAAAPALLLSEPSRDHAVGTVRVLIQVASGRRLPVQIWYPAVESARAEAEAGHPVVEFEPSGSPERRELEQMTRAADPAAYKLRIMHAAHAPAVVESAEPFPLVVASHCTDCLRFGYFVAAERLAARGFVVAAPDHVQNTLYNNRAGNSVGIDMNDFLLTRSQDIVGIIDTFLKADAEVIPSGMRGKIDASRIGMFGHSYGAITTALTSGDPRIRAVAFLAMIASLGDNLPYAGDELAKRIERKPFSKPSLFVVAQEDMINLFGLNDIIRQNYEDYPVPSWLATLNDTGHYSVCTICGLIPELINCSGRDFRTTRLFAPFTYLDIEYANSLTASLLTSFFEQQLLGEASTSLEAIANAAPKGVLTVEHHP